MSSFLYAIDLGLAALLYTKFGEILDLESINKGVIFYPKHVAQREIAEKRGNTEVEFINYWRTSMALDWERQNTPMARRGVNMPYPAVNPTDAIEVKAMPVKLGYQVWFWSKDKDKLNQIAETYLFWQHTNPNLDLQYQDEYPLDLDLHFGEIVDESVVEEKWEKGMYFIYSMPITIDGWVFTSTDPINNIIYTIQLTCYDKDDLVTYEELIVPESSDYDPEKVAALKLFERTITE